MFLGHDLWVPMFSFSLTTTTPSSHTHSLWELRVVVDNENLNIVTQWSCSTSPSVCVEVTEHKYMYSVVQYVCKNLQTFSIHDMIYSSQKQLNYF